MSQRGGGVRVRGVDAVVQRRPTSVHAGGEVSYGRAWWSGGGKRLAKRAAAAHDGVLLGMDLRSGVVLWPGWHARGLLDRAMEMRLAAACAGGLLDGSGGRLRGGNVMMLDGRAAGRHDSNAGPGNAIVLCRDVGTQPG